MITGHPEIRRRVVPWDIAHGKHCMFMVQATPKGALIKFPHSQAVHEHRFSWYPLKVTHVS